MPRQFWRTTAEAVVSAVETAASFQRAVTSADVSEFANVSADQATAGLELAADLNLLKLAGVGAYVPSSPLCRSFATSDQSRRASALRIVLEQYEPYYRFLERLDASADAGAAGRQVRQLLDLSVHPDEAKETLLSLGQYAQALRAEGGGRYRRAENA